MRIAIVAGEASGDLLGADLIHAIREQTPNVQFEGIAGPQMVEAGCQPLYPSEKLAVMGLVEVLKHLREIINIRKSVIAYWLSNPPDVFIGIDAPDFNFVLERVLKEHQIPTVHYVSPSVWAWRRSRVKKIGRSTDLMLTLFPFEAKFYRDEGIKVEFVGHPLADIIDLTVDTVQARERLELPQDKKIIALLPGSRRSEISRLSPPFIEAALWSLQQDPSLHFVVPLINSAAQELFEKALREVGGEKLPITLVDRRSREVMAASDVILLASGTATLEALLLKKPMVVAYKLSEISYQIMSRMLTVPYYSLPNNLAGEEVVKEFTQREVTAENLGSEIITLLNDAERTKNLVKRFNEIHHQLKQNASQRAADAILGLISREKG
ncbi:MAG: lipid-A-disaccharide synthase [Gammaproteobacteria bacterium]|nr:lipid-A-disaccharide synthase [Gammaproteobacteria bacterium]